MKTSQTQAIIAEVMASLGFDAVTSGVFQAPWSTAEVEHYLYWRSAFRGTSLTFDYGFRNLESETYARDCACLYGGSNRRKLQSAFRNHRCYMSQFSARIASDTKQILIILSSEAALRSVVADVAQETVMPAVSSIVSLEALRSILVSRDDRCPWWATNGAIRAAKIVKLGRMLGAAPHDIETSLAGHEDDIQRGFPPDRNARDYIANILAHDAAKVS